MARVQAKVATLLGMNRFALTKGSTDGVAQGSLVNVQQLVDVVDPETQAVLGQAPALVGQLQVIHVEERFSIAAPSKEERTFAMGLTSAQSAESISVGDDVSINAS